MHPSPLSADARRRCREAFTGFAIREFSRTPSTQDLARDAARRGAAPGLCIVADEQTAGRGRSGRRWITDPGTALALSIIVAAPRNIAATPLAAGLAVAESVESFGVTALLKWPNDVLVATRKLAGILVEVEPAGVDATVVIGIGMNLAVAAFPDDVPGISLDAVAGRLIDRNAVIGELVPALARRLRDLDEGGVAALRDDWLRRAAGIGELVIATTAAGEVRGVARDIDSNGSLVIETNEGNVTLVAGDVHIGIT